MEKLGCEGKIAKHNDNGSMVSVVVLLSDPSDFEGGNWVGNVPFLFRKSLESQP